jgi:molecular chaperone Hsp33
MPDTDQLHRFLFEDLDIRGEYLQLDASWKAVLDRYEYPSAVRSQLGQALAATLLLSATIKFEGSLILQSQSQGPISTLVAQATHNRTLRGLARWNDEVSEGSLEQMYGNGTMVLTIDARGRERYQGIVPLEGTSLAHALEGYFSKSEQLESRLWLAADGERAAGLFLQQLPSEHRHAEDWNRISMLSETVTPEELLELDTQTLLHRLYHEEQLRLFDPEPVAFRCECSRDRIEHTLKAMGYAEVKGLLEEQGSIAADCEFCNKHYEFDPVDIEQMFAQDVPIDAPTTPQ